MKYAILPLGDSITSNGFGLYSYRYFLWKSLVTTMNDEIDIDFVGTLQDNYAILDNIEEWLDSY